MKKLSRPQKFLLFLIITLVLFVVTVLISIWFGAVKIHPAWIGKILANKLFRRELFTQEWEDNIASIVWDIRLPRVIESFLIGSGLALAGLGMQALTKNSLADPYVLGISSGASAGAVFMIMTGALAFLGLVMREPEMILFDYGHTLVYELVFDRTAGFRAVLGYCTANPGVVKAEELDTLYGAALSRLTEASRAADCDFMDMAAKRLLYESLELRFSEDLCTLERIFWDAAGPGVPMPGIRELLAELKRRGIRTGVLSNMNFREKSVRDRIDQLLPENAFEFVLCSCEYATRKPRADFFRLCSGPRGLRPPTAPGGASRPAP